MNNELQTGLVPRVVSEWWRDLCARRADDVCVRGDDQNYSFADIERRASALARGLLARGWGNGSHIGLLLHNGPEWIIGWLAIERIGAVAVTLSTLFAPPELLQTLEHADVEVLLSTRRYLGHDYAQRIEEALPELTGASGKDPLALAAAPSLRAIYFDSLAGREWSAGTFADLEFLGNSAPGFSEILLRSVEERILPTDTAMLLYTSGSTAMPKAVLHSQQTIVSKIQAMAGMNCIIPAEVEPGDCLLINNPLFWIGGFLACFCGLENGGHVVFGTSLAPGQLWEDIDRYAVTHVSGGEAVLRSLQGHPSARGRKIDTLLKPQNSGQLAYLRGAQGYDKAQIGNSIGMTETFGPHTGPRSIAETRGALAGTWGWPLGGMEHRIVDRETGAACPLGRSGELLVRGPWLMQGYYKNSDPELFDAQGFYHTGDLCVLDGAGRIDFLGRISGMIKTSGANVAPDEVEVALRRHPGVIEAVVLGVPDEARGELVVAVVAPALDAQLDEVAIRAWLKNRISSFKIPRRVLFMTLEDMPKTTSHKIHRPSLEQWARQALSPGEMLPASRSNRLPRRQNQT